jgi:hypothetical protein
MLTTAPIHTLTGHNFKRTTCVPGGMGIPINA